MEEASSKLYTTTEIIEDTQTEIKMLIKASVFKADDMLKFVNRVKVLVEKNLEEIKDETIKEVARQGLLKFGIEQYNKTVRLLDLGNLPIIIAYADAETRKHLDGKALQKQIDEKINSIGRAKINKAFTNLGNSQAKTVNGQSLYGYSEMAQRRDEQTEMIDKLKAKTNLVVCDTHSDCSDRCFEWQGRVYSLDGTYGTTSDGRKYIPLEVAKNATFKGHRNGLLGYNCRHKLVAYQDGLKPVKVSKREAENQYAITSKQRLLEHEIRSIKDLKLSFKGLDKEKYNFYLERQKVLTVDYRKFCEENNRVEYRSRLQI